MKVKPEPPGTVLRKYFLKPFGITRKQLASRCVWSLKQVDRICDNEAAVTPEKALILGVVFQVRPEFWLKLQAARDLWSACRKAKILPDHLMKSALSTEITRTIKIPYVKGWQSRRRKYPFNELGVGDSHEVAAADPVKAQQAIHSALYIYNKKHGVDIKITTRTGLNNVIFWRIK